MKKIMLAIALIGLLGFGDEVKAIDPQIEKLEKARETARLLKASRLRKYTLDEIPYVYSSKNQEVDLEMLGIYLDVTRACDKSEERDKLACWEKEIEKAVENKIQVRYLYTLIFQLKQSEDILFGGR